MSAQQVVSCLNTIFSEFDILTELYEMEKIKTIGSTFMVAGGVPKPSTGIYIPARRDLIFQRSRI
jgi:adenylate cyclase